MKECPNHDGNEAGKSGRYSAPPSDHPRWNKGELEDE